MQIINSFITNCPCFKYNANKADNRYVTFQTRGPLGLMLHSVGCAQPNATVFVNNWNKSSNTNVAVHAVIDSNTGVVRQCLPWNYRGWHGGGNSNNTHIGVEMCESNYIRYLKPGEVGYAPAKFEILDRTKAQEHCANAYNSAVELFAMLCKEYNLDPLKDIISHKEGYKLGIATGHTDPEHYWAQLGMPYTMDVFRADVREKMGLGAPKQEDNILYRIQVGSFKNKNNADNYLKEVKKYFPGAIIVTVKQN